MCTQAMFAVAVMSAINHSEGSEPGTELLLLLQGEQSELPLSLLLFGAPWGSCTSMAPTPKGCRNLRQSRNFPE